MPNAFDLLSLTVVNLAPAQIRITDRPDGEFLPDQPYLCPFIYYAGRPTATGFNLSWYATEALRTAATTPGGGTLVSNPPSGVPVNKNGGGNPLIGSPLPAPGIPPAGTVQTGYVSGGRTPSVKPDGTDFDENTTYYGKLWIIQA